MTRMYLNLFFPLKVIDFRVRQCVQMVDWDRVTWVHSERPFQFKCQRGSQLLQVPFEHFCRHAPEEFLEKIPRDVIPETVGFYVEK